MEETPFLQVFERGEELSAHLAEAAQNADEAEVQNLLLNPVKKWARSNLDSHKIDKESCLPEEVLSTAKEFGLFGLTIPEEYGGMGLSMKGAAHIIEELAPLDRSLAVTVGLHIGLAMRGLLGFGSDFLKKKYLPRLASGEMIAAFAATEANAGSDLAAISTTARENADCLRLNGSKVYVTNGGLADVATVYAQTPGLAGIKKGKSLLLVPLSLTGIKRDREEVKLGIKGTSTLTLHFTDVNLQKDHLIGEPGKGVDYLNSALSWGRTMLSAGSLGIGNASYMMALQYGNTRIQFGRPIADFGMSREILAGMAADLYAGQSLVRLVTQLFDSGKEDISWESAISKVFATEAAWTISDGCVQLHGGMGFIEETGASMLLRDARIGRIFEGANELLRFHIASAALGWKADDLGVKLDFVTEPYLQESVELFQVLLKRVVKAKKDIKEKYGISVFQHQVVLRRLADVIIPSYVMAATLLRTQGECKKGPSEKTSLCLELCRLAARNLSKRAHFAAQELAADDEGIIYKITEKEYSRILP